VNRPEPIEGLSAAGVPVLLRRPERAHAPLVVLWHGLAPPSSPQALAEALPLEDLPAWKAYPCLPLLAGRLPAGGVAEILERQQEDYVLELLLPVVAGAVAELPRMVEALAKHAGGQPEDAIGLFGYAAGAMAVLLALAERRLPVAAAAVLAAPRNLDVAVESFERFFGLPYRWAGGASALRARLDFEARAGDIASGDSPPALLLLHGEADEMFDPENARSLYRALEPHYRSRGRGDRLKLELLPDFTHSFARGGDPAGTFPTSDAAPVERALTAWFQEQLEPGEESPHGGRAR
jgi:dienelactone hydrolase